jgi:hypothetical protein
VTRVCRQVQKECATKCKELENEYSSKFQQLGNECLNKCKELGNDCANKCKDLEETNASLEEDKERLQKEHADLVCTSKTMPIAYCARERKHYTASFVRGC